jgi:iron(III) transport system ATP-binding protein
MVKVEGLIKEFPSTYEGAVRAVREISFEVKDKTIFTLLGPSGCGKTTTLRCIAGLERPEGGKISIADRVVVSSEQGIFIPPEQRAIGMVFQSYAIWPHMTVYQNVSYALKNKGLSKDEIKKKVTKVLEMVELGHLIDRPAPNLSGGQQQRVALARALVSEPQVLLFDEPLSNLDAKLRHQMRSELRRLQRETGVTAVYVTHDQEEALAISDEIAVMLQGEIVELGKPQEIYQRPKSQFTADFLGFANFLKAKVVEKKPDGVLVEVAGRRIACNPCDVEVGQQVTMFFRPEDVTLSGQEPSRGTSLMATVTDRLFLGQMVDCRLKVGSSEEVIARIHPKYAPDMGDQVFIAIDPEFLTLLPRED